MIFILWKSRKLQWVETAFSQDKTLIKVATDLYGEGEGLINLKINERPLLIFFTL